MALHPPVKFISMGKELAAMQIMFEGLMCEYIECVSRGDVEKWRLAAVGIIELVSSNHDSPAPRKVI